MYLWLYIFSVYFAATYQRRIMKALKCPSCQKEIRDPKAGYKVQLSTSDDGYTYSLHVFLVCSEKCRLEMYDNIRNIITRTTQDCCVCSEPGTYICPVRWLPITFEFCSVMCMQYIENVLNEQQLDPVYNLLNWVKEKKKETHVG